MLYFKRVFVVKRLRPALCLPALLLISVSNLPAQTPANKTPHPANASLPKLRTETAKTLAFKVIFSRRYQIPNGEPNKDQLNHVADYSVQLKRPIWLRIVDLTTTYRIALYQRQQRRRLSYDWGRQLCWQ